MSVESHVKHQLARQVELKDDFLTGKISEGVYQAAYRVTVKRLHELGVQV